MTTLTIRRKALAKQEEVPQIHLRKYSRGWHFVARLLCRLATVVFQHEQPDADERLLCGGSYRCH